MPLWVFGFAVGVVGWFGFFGSGFDLWLGCDFIVCVGIVFRFPVGYRLVGLV